MDPPTVSRYGRTATRKRTDAVIYPACHVKATGSLQALMKSALLLLIKSEASKAVSQSRVWRSRSDLSCHQFRRTLGIVQESRYEQSLPRLLAGGSCSILLLVRQERPDNPGVLIGSRDGGTVFSPSGNKRREPPTPGVSLRPDPAKGRPGAVDE